jgi:NitT/TauT family transport system substrate-binding protein
MYRDNGASSTHRVSLVKLRAVKFRKFACTLLAPALLAAAAACASQGGNGNGAGGQSPITMAVQIAAPTSAPVYVADALGYFKQQGLNVNVETLSNDYLSIAAGQIPYGLVGVSQLIPAAAKGTGLQEICVTQVDPSYILAVSQKTLKADGITPSMSLKETLTRLKGEKVTEVGGPLTPGGILLADLLRRNGLPANWIKVISQTSSASATASFYSGQVGVAFQPQPVPDQLLSKVPGRIIYNTRGSSLFSNLAQVAWSGVVGSKSYIAAHPNVSRKICAAIGKADTYLTGNPAQAAKVLQPKMTAFALKFLQDGLTTYKWAKGGKMTDAQFQAGVKVLASYGIVKEPSANGLRTAYTSAYQS